MRILFRYDVASQHADVALELNAAEAKLAAVESEVQKFSKWLGLTFVRSEGKLQSQALIYIADYYGLQSILQICQGSHCFASVLKTDQVRAVEELLQDLSVYVDVQGELLLVFTNIDPRAHDAEYIIGVQVEAGGNYKGESCNSTGVCLHNT